MNRYRFIFCALLAAISVSCNTERVVPTSSTVGIWPDYRNVTIPDNIAPLNFSYTGEGDAVLFVDDDILIKSSHGTFKFSKRLWRRLMAQDSVKLQIAVDSTGVRTVRDSFHFYVSHDSIDPFVSYRLIPPGYQGWKQMGLYQRDLRSYRQTTIYENNLGKENCVNCHTPCNRDPETRLFHVRTDYGGTMVVSGGEIEKLNTKTDSTISALVYPYWHPSGKYIAFSVNATKQSFFSHDPNRIEVFDSASDVVVYDVENHSIIWSPLTKTADNFETFPIFSPDGRYLYFCSCRSVEKMPEDYAEAHYDLKRIAFDPTTAAFGDSLETVYDAASQSSSVSFPRISPDGRFLCFTKHGYGNFSIWHKDSDLWLMDLETGLASPMTEANSADVDSYHCWSGNSRWLIFSSRRDDGLYTKLYICHVDDNGVVTKPFLLPQKDPVRFYRDLMFSYNIPEFMSGRVRMSPAHTAHEVRRQKGTDVTVGQ